ncbi:T9SS type A sorting domain-containing protein [Flavobacterium sp.]|uniref:T9SS type A sorting domain-containing protein n=1 Tax=Flavobacterium sp. TaxID=239 RepID=UPI00375053B9
MKSSLLFLMLFSSCVFSQSVSFTKTWSTYYCDGYTFVNMSAVDKLGNIYMVGNVKGNGVNSQFTPTLNAHQTQYGGGTCDGFITKFSPNGEIVWATFFGGINDDAIESISIDGNSNLILSGSTTSPNNIATTNSYRPNITGNINSYLSKFTSDGQLIWSTYLTDYNSSSTVGVGNSSILLTDTSVTHDANNNIYIISTTGEDNQATSGTFQTDKQSAKSLISKFSPNGQVIWSTYYGINESYLSGLCVNQAGLYVSGRSSSCNQTVASNYFATPNCYQSDGYNECGTPFVSKFDLIGLREWSTYYGGNNIQEDIILKNSIKCFDDNLYFVGYTYLDTDIATTGSFQENKDFQYCNYLAKFNSSGQKIWGTYIGLNILNNYIILQNSLELDFSGNVYVSGVTNFQNNISTPGCFQNNIVYTQPDFNVDAFAMKFNPNGERIWGTYFGGENPEYLGNILLYQDYFYMYGFTQSTSGISTPNALQENYNTNGISNFYDSNIFLARFDPIPLSNSTFNEDFFSIYPNPNNGTFTISLKEYPLEHLKLELYDVLGKKLATQSLGQLETSIKTNNLAKGIYLAKIYSKNKSTSKKIIVE